jgi:hypothetical protein
MAVGTNARRLAQRPTRRQLVTAIGIASCSQILNTALWGKSQDQAMKELPGTTANKNRTTLHQEID